MPNTQWIDSQGSTQTGRISYEVDGIQLAPNDVPDAIMEANGWTRVYETTSTNQTLGS